MKTWGPSNGFSLIEVLVALLIFSVVAAGLAETLVAAQTTRRTSSLRMTANQLAVAETERNRAGTPTSGVIRVGDFTCTSALETVAGYADLVRLRVTVDWMDRSPRQLELITLMSTGPK